MSALSKRHMYQCGGTIAWWPHNRKVQHEWEKIIAQNGSRSHATRFQGKCACLLSRQTWLNLWLLLLRQVGCPLHHWCYAVLVEDLEYDRGLDESESSGSLQEKQIFSFKKNHWFRYISTLCLLGRKSNEQKMQLWMNYQWDLPRHLTLITKGMITFGT